MQTVKQQTGTVKWFDAQKGLGLIHPDNGDNDLFIYTETVESAGMQALRAGQRLDYDLQFDIYGRWDNAVNLNSYEVVRNAPDKASLLPPVRILVVTNDHAEIAYIKTWLEQDMQIPWNIMHCVSVEEARQNLDYVDLVILNPEMQNFQDAEKAFKAIKDKAYETQIIVLTNEGDAEEYTTYFLNEGAAGTVVHGQFDGLANAIEYALIWQKQEANEQHRQTLRMLSGEYSVDQRR